MLDKLKFELKAKNRHGIHSRFVYDFLDKTLYDKSLKNYTSEYKLLIAVLIHFNPKRIGIEPNSEILTEWLNRDMGLQTSSTGPFDLYLSAGPTPNLAGLINTKENWTPDSIIYVGGIRTTQKHFEKWKNLCNLEVCRVSIETYTAGMLCFRPQQEPQHFKIRLNSSIFESL